MKTAAIICEYNPFHNGHLYHLEETKKILGEESGIICLMSGDFVQRGEPAYDDKWHRAEIAVKAGADLVIELPFRYACNGAAQFAKGAVQILNQMKIVDYLSFGSESGNIEKLKEIADSEEDIRKEIRGGKAYSKAMRTSELLESPNNILGVEYLRALAQTGSDIRPITVKRGNHKSSSFIRQKASEGKDISEDTPFPYKGYTDGIPFDLIAGKIISTSAEELDSLPSSGEGIGFKLKNEIRMHDTTESLIDAVKQRRYTKARISRVLCQMLVGMDSGDCIRVLAVGKNGSTLIRRMIKEDVNVVTNINKKKGVGLSDILASDIYNLIRGRNLYSNSDYVMKPYIGIEK